MVLTVWGAPSMAQFKEELEGVLEVEMVNTGEGELNSGCENCT